MVTIKELYDKVFELYGIMNTPKSEILQAMPFHQRENRSAFMFEEIDEFCIEDDLTDQVDALADLFVFILGTLVMMGVDGEKFGKIMHAVIQSSYDKLWEDGKPRFRENDGKWIKPPSWVGPEAKISKILYGDE